jgi:hypothetical protein
MKGETSDRCDTGGAKGSLFGITMPTLSRAIQLPQFIHA